MDPIAATPLMTFSVFDDFVASKGIALVRGDILNPSIDDTEGRKVVASVLENYKNDLDFLLVKTFNQHPERFDSDDFISQMKERWHQDTTSSNDNAQSK